MLTKRKRRVLFYAAILAFFILLFPIIFYSQGYRLGSDFRLHKTGGIFIKASEAGAEVSWDGASKNTSIITKAVLVKNLLPESYDVSVSKDGFWTWSKKLPVLPEEVTARNALLMPKTAQRRILGTSTPPVKSSFPSYPSVKKFWKMPDTESFLILGEDGKLYKDKEPFDVLRAWPEGGTTTAEILKSKKKSFFDESFSGIVYWDAHNIDFYWFEDLAQMPSWQKEQRAHIFSSDSPLADVQPYPNWPDYLIVASGDGIYTLEMDSTGGQNVFPLYKGTEPKIFFVDEESPALIILDQKQYIQIELE